MGSSARQSTFGGINHSRVLKNLSKEAVWDSKAGHMEEEFVESISLLVLSDLFC